MDIEITYWYWWIAAAVMLGLEITAPGVIFLWLSIAAAIVGGLLLVVPGLSWEMQLVIFAVLSVASVVIFRRFIRKEPSPTDQPNLNRRGSQYVGRQFTLKEPVVNGEGKISVDDSTWRVRGPDLPAGSVIRITAVDGVLFDIEAV